MCLKITQLHMHYVQLDVLPSKNQALHYFNNCAIVMDCMWLNEDSLLIDIHTPRVHVQPTLDGVGS